MRRRNLIVTSDSDEEDDEGTATTASASASASASVASSGGGGGSGGRLSNPSPLPIPFPSLSLSPTAPVVISDDDEEEDVEEILDADGDSPIVEAAEDISPPAPAPPPPPPPAGTPNPTLVRTPTPAPVRTPTPTLPPAGGPSSAPFPSRTPTPTPPPARGPSPAAQPRSTPPPSAMSGPLRPVDEFLLRLGLRLRPEWLESCAAGLPGFDALGGAEAQARRCFEQFLFADMNTCGAGVLPEGVGSMHGAVLDGPFVLQVDEIVNMSAPLRERYRGTHAGPKRCLKLSMTDGIQRIFGMEYRPIKDLEVLASAGLKVVIRNVHIKRGLLILVPEVIEILGGVVDDLEAARDRLVSEVNKPPRGKRKQGGLPLSSRATLAAWPCSTNVINGGEQGISLPATVNASHPTGLGNGSQVGRTTATLTSELVSRPVMANIVQEQSRHVQEIHKQGLSTSRNNTRIYASVRQGHDGSQTIREEYVDPSIMANNSHEQERCIQDVTMQEQATAFVRIERSSISTPRGYDSNHGPHAVVGIGADDVESARSSSRHVHGINAQNLSTSRNNTGASASVPNGHDRTHTIREEHVDPFIMANNFYGRVQHSQEFTMQEQATAFVRNERRPSISIPSEYDSNHGSHAVGGTGPNDVDSARCSSPHVQEINMQDLSSFRNNTETSVSIPNRHNYTRTIKEEYVNPSIMAIDSRKQVQCVQDVTLRERAIDFVKTERSSTSTPCEYDSHHSSDAIAGTGTNDVEAALTSNLDDEIDHMEHLIILNGENEKPFTYIISMLADWGTRQDTEVYIQGKIKGLITSVKSFQYRRRTEYELYIYIDDGSYISMAIVDHNIVKNMIGLSPEEVTAALSGESVLVSTNDMKETLRGFQRFLVKFEGMMLIEFNKNSSIPIVRELNEGCSSSDAWLLLGRLKAFSSRRRMKSLDDMDTTP